MSELTMEMVPLLTLAAVWMAAQLAHAQRDYKRSLKMRQIAQPLGLTFEPGLGTYNALLPFDIADNEFLVEVTDRMHGQLQGIQLAVFDLLQHETIHSSKPPRPVTVLHCLSRGMDWNRVAALARQKGLAFEMFAAQGAIIYQPGRSLPVEQMPQFIFDSLAVFKEAIVSTNSTEGLSA